MYRDEELGGLRATVSTMLLAAGYAVAWPTHSVAQTTLEGIVIEGATLDTGSSDDGADNASGTTPGIASEKVGSAVTVVTRAQLEAQKVRHAGEALRSLPGVHVSQSGSFGNLTQVRIRGA
ncbi:MAG: TonB-dependent receptor plug domain-containing protein, partial [Pseudomonadota bacterium]